MPSDKAKFLGCSAQLVLVSYHVPTGDHRESKAALVEPGPSRHMYITLDRLPNCVQFAMSPTADLVQSLQMLLLN